MHYVMHLHDTKCITPPNSVTYVLLYSLQLKIEPSWDNYVEVPVNTYQDERIYSIFVYLYYTYSIIFLEE